MNSDSSVNQQQSIDPTSNSGVLLSEEDIMHSDNTTNSVNNVNNKSNGINKSSHSSKMKNRTKGNKPINRRMSIQTTDELFSGEKLVDFGPDTKGNELLGVVTGGGVSTTFAPWKMSLLNQRRKSLDILNLNASLKQNNNKM
ncbi:hypothetical protein ABK040_002659 [Willaertia magna]